MTAYERHPTGGFVYGLRCSCHPDAGIRYIGKTVSLRPRYRLYSHANQARNGSMLPVHRWIRKHGPENIIQSVLEEITSGHEDLLRREIYWIAEVGTTSSPGLNCTAGGDGSLGWRRSAESEAKRAKTLRERYPRVKKAKLTKEEYRATRVRGSASGTAKLNEDLVSEIKSAIWDGAKHSEISKIYGVTPCSISCIGREATWKHVPWPSDRPRTVLSPGQKRATITAAQVLEIRKLGKQGLGCYRISAIMGVSVKQASTALSGRGYNWVVDNSD